MYNLKEAMCPVCGAYPCLCERIVPRDSETVIFAKRVAKTMDSLRSSNVFFILQQSYPDNEDWEWSDFQELLTRIINA